VLSRLLARVRWNPACRSFSQLRPADDAMLEIAARTAPAWRELLQKAQADPETEPVQRVVGKVRRATIIEEAGGQMARAIGRRKESVAMVTIKRAPAGALGNVTVNSRPHTDYFPWPLSTVAVSPFLLTDTSARYDAHVMVKGGGKSGQAQAMRHGIATALQGLDLSLRPKLKHADMLTRDPRVKERKKPGKPKARKSEAWVKR